MKGSKSVLAVLAAALVLMGCGGDNGKRQLNVYNWTEYIPEDVLDDFKTEFNVDLVYDNFTSNEEMYAKLKAGASGYDITFPTQDFVPLMISDGMLQELDLSKVPNFQGIDPGILAANTYDPGNKYTVPYSFGTTALVYWKDKVSNPGDSWAILDRTDLAGKIVLMDDMREVIGAALKFQGNSVNSVDQAQINSARDLVNRWKRNVVKFDNDIVTSGFATKEFWLAFNYPETTVAEVPEEEMANVGFLFPKEGGAMYLDSMVILKDAKNVELAYEFINFILRPEIYARIMDAYGYPGLIPAATPLRTSTPWYTSEDLPNSEFRLDVGDNIELYNRAWQEIRVGL